MGPPGRSLSVFKDRPRGRRRRRAESYLDMKLGLGLYRDMLTPENFRFAKQAGATHIVAHWVDYFHSGPRIPQSESAGYGWGITQNQNRLWTVQELIGLRE